MTHDDYARHTEYQAQARFLLDTWIIAIKAYANGVREGELGPQDVLIDTLGHAVGELPAVSILGAIGNPSEWHFEKRVTT